MSVVETCEKTVERGTGGLKAPYPPSPEGPANTQRRASTERIFPMPASIQSASSSLSHADAGDLRSQKRADLTYQAVTVAAILMLLASLWVF